MSYNTNRKNEIIDFLSANSKTAFSAKEISDAVLVDGRGQSTVYRLIDSLVKSGDIKRIREKGSRHVYYQYIKKEECKEHLHLKCAECGKLIHLGHKLSETLLKNIENQTHFALDLSEVLFGKCEDCR